MDDANPTNTCTHHPKSIQDSCKQSLLIGRSVGSKHLDCAINHKRDRANKTDKGWAAEECHHDSKQVSDHDACAPGA